jgi:hypothetical protein
MPKYDGTGPRGRGPMTGRGEGFCAIRLPQPGQPAFGYAGQQAEPVYLKALAPWLPDGVRLARRSPGARRRGPRLRRGRRLAGWSRNRRSKESQVVHE